MYTIFLAGMLQRGRRSKSKDNMSSQGELGEILHNFFKAGENSISAPKIQKDFCCISKLLLFSSILQLIKV